MPTLLTEQIRCSQCRTRKPRYQFSVADGICLDCFYADYAFCIDCGRIVRHAEHDSTYSRAHPSSDGVHCYDCAYDHCHGRGNRWRPTPLEVSFASYDRIGSKIKFGVEIETARCTRYADLRGQTPFGCKSDCTVTGMEFDSPILYGDEGLTVIEKFLEYGDDHNWTTDNMCGCHTHYDMRDMTDDQLVSIAYAYRRTCSFWRSLIPRHRSDGTYSHTPHWSCSDFKRVWDSVNTFSRLLVRLNLERYDLVNLAAYRDHKTFEVRMLEGTCDAETICNWIILNCRFIDGVQDMTIEEIDVNFGCGSYDAYRQAAFAVISKMVDDDDLTAWMLERNWEHDRNHPLVAGENVEDEIAF